MSTKNMAFLSLLQLNRKMTLLLDLLGNYSAKKAFIFQAQYNYTAQLCLKTVAAEYIHLHSW